MDMKLYILILVLGRQDVYRTAGGVNLVGVIRVLGSVMVNIVGHFLVIQIERSVSRLMEL